MSFLFIVFCFLIDKHGKNIQYLDSNTNHRAQLKGKILKYKATLRSTGRKLFCLLV